MVVTPPLACRGRVWRLTLAQALSLSCANCAQGLPPHRVRRPLTYLDLGAMGYRQSQSSLPGGALIEKDLLLIELAAGEDLPGARRGGRAPVLARAEFARSRHPRYGYSVSMDLKKV